MSHHSTTTPATQDGEAALSAFASFLMDGLNGARDPSDKRCYYIDTVNCLRVTHLPDSERYISITIPVPMEPKSAVTPRTQVFLNHIRAHHAGAVEWMESRYKNLEAAAQERSVEFLSEHLRLARNEGCQSTWHWAGLKFTLDSTIPEHTKLNIHDDLQIIRMLYGGVTRLKLDSECEVTFVGIAPESTFKTLTCILTCSPIFDQASTTSTSPPTASLRALSSLEDSGRVMVEQFNKNRKTALQQVMQASNWLELWHGAKDLERRAVRTWEDELSKLTLQKEWQEGDLFTLRFTVKAPTNESIRRLKKKAPPSDVWQLEVPSSSF